MYYALSVGYKMRMELLDLKVADVNLDDYSQIVRAGKGNKSRTVYLPDVCIEALRDWLSERPAFTMNAFFLPGELCS